MKNTAIKHEILTAKAVVMVRCNGGYVIKETYVFGFVDTIEGRKEMRKQVKDIAKKEKAHLVEVWNYAYDDYDNLIYRGTFTFLPDKISANKI